MPPKVPPENVRSDATQPPENANQADHTYRNLNVTGALSIVETGNSDTVTFGACAAGQRLRRNGNVFEGEADVSGSEETGYQYMTGNSAASISNSGHIDLSVTHTEIFNPSNEDWFVVLPNGTLDKQVHTITYQSWQKKRLYVDGYFLVNNDGDGGRGMGRAFVDATIEVRNAADNGNEPLGGYASMKFRWRADRSLWIPIAINAIVCGISYGDFPE